jgi:hypothetical protein
LVCNGSENPHRKITRKISGTNPKNIIANALFRDHDKPKQTIAISCYIFDYQTEPCELLLEL